MITGESFLAWCRHYTGALDKACDAGVTYTDLVPRGPGWLTKLPCIRANNSTVICPQHSYYSNDEAVAKAEDASREAAAYLQKLFVDRACPRCARVYEGKQVGRCVYCEHCGMRLYQGTLSRRSEAER